MTKQIGHSFLSINIVYHLSLAHCRYSDCYLFAKLHNNTQTKKEEIKYLALFDKMAQELKKYLFLASFTSKTGLATNLQVLFVLGRGFYRGFILSVLADN
ncbi:MAG: hypothetical protein IJ159_03875 [Prevotella sp.]|nr:hypothetical protein [Prevotella sp.]MBQ9215879.1 hypothetical protein [Prevotella sp.]